MVFAADWSSFFSERKVDIRSMDADFWKVHNGHVAALTVDCIPPLSGHLQPNSPSILAWIVGGLLCDEITVKDDDWNLGELHELAHGHADRRERPPELGSDSGTSPSGNRKPLPGSNATIPRTLSVFRTVAHPSPPPCE